MNRLRTAFQRVHRLRSHNRSNDSSRDENATNGNVVKNRALGQVEKILKEDDVCLGKGALLGGTVNAKARMDEVEGMDLPYNAGGAGYPADLGREKQVPTYAMPITQASTIPGDYSYEVFPSYSGPHRLASYPSPSQEPSVLIEETWFLEDAVRKGKLNKSNLLGEQIVAPSKSRLHLPSIRRRSKPDAQDDRRQDKDRRDRPTSPSILSLSNAANVRVHLGVHADVFRKVKLPDIHRVSSPLKDTNNETRSGITKEEKRARKKAEKRERIERERRERKERKNEKKERKEKGGMKNKDKKKRKEIAKEPKVEKIAAVSDSHQDDSSKNKKSRIRNIFSSGLRLKQQAESEPSTLTQGPCSIASNKNLILGATGRVFVNEVLNSEKKLSLITSDSVTMNPRKDRSVVNECVEDIPHPARLSPQPSIRDPSNISEKKSSPKLLLDARTFSGTEKENLQKSEDTKTTQKSSLELVERFNLSDNDSEIRGPACTPLSSENNVKGSESAASKQDKTNDSLKQSVKDEIVGGQEVKEDKKSTTRFIDVDLFNSQVKPLKPPTVTQIFVDVPVRTRPKRTPAKAKVTNPLEDSAMCPDFRASRADNSHNITSSCINEGPSTSKPSEWNCSKPANLFQAECKGKRVDHSKRIIILDTKINPSKISCSESSNQLDCKTKLGPIRSKKIEVQPAFNRSFKITETKEKQAPQSLKIPASHLGKKELPPVFGPNLQATSPTRQPKPRKNRGDIKKKLSSQGPCISTIQGRGKGHRTAFPSGFGPVLVKPPVKVLPEIKTKSPDIYIPTSPTTMDIGRLRYIPSDEEEDNEVITGSRPSPFLQEWSSPIERPIGRDIYGCFSGLNQGQPFSDVVKSSDEENGPFVPRPPSSDRPHNKSKMLARRAKNLMRKTFKPVPNKVAPAPLSTTASPTNISVEKEHIHKGVSDDTVEKLWDLMIEDCEYTDNEL